MTYVNVALNVSYASWLFAKIHIAFCFSPAGSQQLVFFHDSSKVSVLLLTFLIFWANFLFVAAPIQKLFLYLNWDRCICSTLNLGSLVVFSKFMIRSEYDD